MKQNNSHFLMSFFYKNYWLLKGYHSIMCMNMKLSICKSLVPHFLTSDFLLRPRHPICIHLQDSERRRKWDTRQREWVFQPATAWICIYKAVNYSKVITTDLVFISIMATLKWPCPNRDRGVSTAVHKDHLCTESVFVYKPSPAWCK